MTRRVEASARFTVTIDVPLGHWQPGETFFTLEEIAKREGVASLRNALADVDFRLVDEPVLTVVMAAGK